MRRFALALVLAIFGSAAFAQQSPSDTPATKQDVQKYLDAMHSREMISQMMDSMLKVQHQMIHEQFLKEKDRLPPDFEDTMNKFLDDFMKSFPWDQILESTVPIYQKHFTKGDLEALAAFYSSPTGQKVVRELPAITAESMQTMMPLIQKQVTSLTENLQRQIAQAKKEYATKQVPKS